MMTHLLYRRGVPAVPSLHLPPLQSLQRPFEYTVVICGDVYKKKKSEEDMQSPDDRINTEEGHLLWQLIAQCTRQSTKKALALLATMSSADVRRRSSSERATYLHLVVNQAPGFYKRYGELSSLVCIIYRLAMRGVSVNGQDEHGNTALHLACIRPNAQSLCPHLIRAGIDPCIMNRKGCRVIHTYQKHQCQLVKGQKSARSGLWHAVETEDVATVNKLLRSWCRVNITRNKTLKDVANETANLAVTKLLNTFYTTNELVCAAMACDVDTVKEILLEHHVNLHQKDEAEPIPKPLLVALGELGNVAKNVIIVLRNAGASGVTEYIDELNAVETAFEESAFYQKVTEGTRSSLLDAVDLIPNADNVHLVSHRKETRQWTYLHFVVNEYIRVKDVDAELAAILIRAVYRLVLAGINVNARDAMGDTALVKAAASQDQNLMAHLVRIGIDPSLTDAKGRAVNEEVYRDKGKLVFDRKYRVADLPGLWVAVESNDVRKSKRWLRSWSRVATYKGDRSLLEIARALSRDKIVALLEQYQHINEFVIATFASDMKSMMNKLALGNGKKKVNTMDDFFFVGFTHDSHAEYMPRPIIITALEICTPQVVDFLVKFGADLSIPYEESQPCGPTALWAFRDSIRNENTQVVARHADVNLRNELGATMLHCAVQKKRRDGKLELIQVLLERGVDIAARDWQGCTARDYLLTQDIEDADQWRQLIDNHVIELVNNDQHYRLESLVVDGYDHILDIRDSNKKKCAKEIASLREFKELLRLLDDIESYQRLIELLHTSVRNGDVNTVSKLSGEKRCAFGRDRAGRTLLHNAVLYEHAKIARFLVEQYPNLVNTTDSLKRTPLHLCACMKERQQIWSILLDGSAEQGLKDANNLSVYDYVREMDSPTAARYRPRGRRWRLYQPQHVVEDERQADYYKKVSTHTLCPLLTASIEADAGVEDIRALTANCPIDLSIDCLDERLLTLCKKRDRADIAEYLVQHCGARAGIDQQDEYEPQAVSRLQLRNLSEQDGMSQLTESSIPRDPTPVIAVQAAE